MPAIDLSRYKPKKHEKDSKPGFLLSDFLNRDISFGKTQVSDKKKEAFYVELSTLLLSDIDLKTSMDLIIVDQEKEKDKALFGDIQMRLLSGDALSDALKVSGKFSEYEFFSIKIGEETGRLAEVLTDLAKFFKSKIQQRRKIIGAVTYPAIVLLTSMGAVLFMIQFVVPMFADVFIRFGGKLPWITSFIIEVSSVTKSYFLVFMVILAFMIGFYIFNRNSLFYRKMSSALLIRLPIIGDIVKKIYLARFANTMRLLVSTDIPLLRSIGLVRQMISFYPIESSLIKVEEDILRGKSLHQSLSAFSFYPPKLIQLIKVGEEVNRLDYFFEKISQQYTEEVEYKTNTISSLLEPLIIIFLGLVVGVILIAMYLPMFQMSNSF
jgi:type IV pilus assembly protein PilC